MAAALIGAISAPALAAGDLRIDADAEYRLVPDAGRLDVAVTFTLTNLKPDAVTDTVITRYYFDGFSIQIPRDASAVTVVDRQGASLGTTEEIVDSATGTSARLLRIVLPTRLYYSESRTFTLHFTLAGGEPRSDSGIRANPAYAAFSVRAWGDPGRSDVTVIIPADFEVDRSGSEVETRLTEDGAQSWFREDVAEPDSFAVFFAARRDSALDSSTVDVGDLTVDVRSWPGDEAWSEQVSEVVARGFPGLWEAVGLDLAGRNRLAIIEALDPTLLGYAGWYLASDDVIELGEALDDHVVLHEMSHIWFNGNLFDGRWINEGLADTYAADAVEAMSGRADARVALVPDVAAAFAVALEEWSFPSTPPSENRAIADREAYGYNAAFFVIDSIVGEIGDAAMRDVLRSAAGDLIAYRSGPTVETVDPRDDWRRLLDLLEEIGGSAQAESLFRRYVVADSDRALLDRRAEVRIGYAYLVERDEDWDTPFVVRSAMSSWEFDEAEVLIDSANRVIELRREIGSLVSDVGVDPPPTLESVYEGALAPDDLGAAASLAEAQLDAAEVLVAARIDVDEPRSLFASIGLWGRDPEVEWRHAADAFEVADLPGTLLEAADVVALLDDAARVGRNRVLWSLVSLLGAGAVAAPAVVVLRRFRRAGSADTGDGRLGDPV